MCVDQGFKILRTDTALDQMRTTLKSAGSNFKSAVTKLLLGQIVITRYNNKTYRIDDIAWNRNIMEEFDVSTDISLALLFVYFVWIWIFKFFFYCSIEENAFPLLNTFGRSTRLNWPTSNNHSLYQILMHKWDDLELPNLFLWCLSKSEVTVYFFTKIKTRNINLRCIYFPELAIWQV